MNFNVEREQGKVKVAKDLIFDNYFTLNNRP